MNPSDYIVPGFEAAGVVAGIKKNGNRDVALIISRTPCRAAATFTQNAFCAAPVLYDKQVLSINPGGAHGVIINSGCANACTGAPGAANARRTAEVVEQTLGAGDHSIFVMSTGVIGVQLPMDRLLGGIPEAVAQLRPDGWLDAAQAIMTTDTRAKLFSNKVDIGSGRSPGAVHFTGISKGAGMIHPNMATMLSTIVTDAYITQPLLQQALSHAINKSFNRISIDGDTSTNDTVLLLANGVADNAEINDAAGLDFAAFQEALTAICIDLSQAIVRDGEGATKFVTVQVNGARSDADAHAAANTIATSPLVKTAFFGGDANWGRFVAAAGRSGAYIEQERCSIFIAGGANANERSGELQLVEGGTPLNYSEARATEIFGLAEIDVRVELGLGSGSATVWTTDLSYEYVKINGDYRT
jgi:glutamate N-acetyltransferase/amino-acid N-acetyltransferase